MEEQGYQLINDAKNVVKDLVATKLPEPGDSDSFQLKRRAPRRPSQQPDKQPEKLGPED